ncbi:DUF5320 domain-containing protein [Candidatus Woesearchaeota archaeon]|nr:DUF5320 domain-containing protein [Candidatus Woesearchaeota archaeon]
MPGIDGTGPKFQGPMTGRGMGPCGCGMAHGSPFRRGHARGFGFRYFEPALTQEDQKKVLEAHKKQIEQEKEYIEKKLKELE